MESPKMWVQVYPPPPENEKCPDLDGESENVGPSLPPPQNWKRAKPYVETKSVPPVGTI